MIKIFGLDAEFIRQRARRECRPVPLRPKREDDLGRQRDVVAVGAVCVGMLGGICTVSSIDARAARKPLERFWRFGRTRRAPFAGFSSLASQPLHAATNCAEAGRRAPRALAVVEVANPSSLARSAMSSFRRLCSTRTRSRKTSHSDTGAADADAAGADTFTVFTGAAAFGRSVTGGGDSSSTNRWITFRSTAGDAASASTCIAASSGGESLCMTRHSSHHRQHAKIRHPAVAKLHHRSMRQIRGRAVRGAARADSETNHGADRLDIVRQQHDDSRRRFASPQHAVIAEQTRQWPITRSLLDLPQRQICCGQRAFRCWIAGHDSGDERGSDA
jgi:hypothetical protein